MLERKSQRNLPTPERPRSAAHRHLEKGTISVHFIRPVVDAVARHGADPSEILREAGIAPELLGIPQARVSAHHYSALWRSVIAHLDDEFFGQDSRRMKAGSFALLTRSVVHCSTLAAALDRAARFLSVYLDDYGVGVSVSGEYAYLSVRQRDADRAPGVFAHETLLVMVFGLACWLVGRRIAVLRAEFAYPEPEHSGEYGAMYSNSLRFSQARTSLIFDAAVLDLPVVQSERTAKDFLRIAPENILLRYKNAQSLASRVRRRLREVLPDELPELETVARELHVAPATLRRKLKAEGHSYQGIKDDLRRDLAITYLSTTPKSIRDIALDLGFLEASAFHRAFRKWTHTSPGAYRRSERPQAQTRSDAGQLPAVGAETHDQ